MAFQNKTIFNRKTGQAIRFVQTAKETRGDLLEMEASFNPHSKEPAPHYHPKQAEDFTVLNGELTIRIDGKLKTLRQGDTLHIPTKPTTVRQIKTECPASCRLRCWPINTTRCSGSRNLRLRYRN